MPRRTTRAGSSRPSTPSTPGPSGRSIGEWIDGVIGSGSKIGWAIVSILLFTLVGLILAAIINAVAWPLFKASTRVASGSPLSSTVAVSRGSFDVLKTATYRQFLSSGKIQSLAADGETMLKRDANAVKGEDFVVNSVNWDREVHGNTVAIMHPSWMLKPRSFVTLTNRSDTRYPLKIQGWFGQGVQGVDMSSSRSKKDFRLHDRDGSGWPRDLLPILTLTEGYGLNRVSVADALDDASPKVQDCIHICYPHVTSTVEGETPLEEIPGDTVVVSTDIKTILMADGTKVTQEWRVIAYALHRVGTDEVTDQVIYATPTRCTLDYWMNEWSVHNQEPTAVGWCIKESTIEYRGQTVPLAIKPRSVLEWEDGSLRSKICDLHVFFVPETRRA